LVVSSAFLTVREAKVGMVDLFQKEKTTYQEHSALARSLARLARY
jgi:hypothetical protein